MDQTVQRFERLKMADLKPESLRVYGQRFRAGMRHYAAFLDSPTTWSYPVAETRATPPASKQRSGKRLQGAKPESLSSPARDGEMIEYPYPLRAGMVVSLSLPPDLSQHEAKRLSAFIASLAVEPQLALPPGTVAEAV